MRRSIRAIACVFTAALAFVPVSRATAQATVQDSRWAPWIGCWAPTTGSFWVASQTTAVCVSRVGDNAVQLTTVDTGRIMSRDTIDASGARRNFTSEGCSGWRSGEWSRDGRRVYLKSELQCSGGVTRTSSGMLTFFSNSEWLDVEGFRSGSSKTSQSTRYVSLSLADSLPPELNDVRRQGAQRDGISRLLAAADVTGEDIEDAVKHVDAAVVETWLIERGQRFELNGKALAKLAKNGVPGSVTDVMIGLTYPDRFALTRDGRSVVGGGPYGGGYIYDDLSACSRMPLVANPRYADYANDPCYVNAYRNYAYIDYGYYGPYFPEYTRRYSAPVVVNRTPHGTMVNGSGYTQGRPPGRMNDGGSSGSTTSGSQSSGGSKSSGGSTTSGSSSSGGEQRTAHKKGG